MHTGNSASDGPDDRQAASDGSDGRQSTSDGGYAVSRRTVLQGAAAAAVGAAALGSAPESVRADHGGSVDWTTTRLDADGASDAFGSALAIDEQGETLVVGDSLRRDGDVPTGGVSVYVAEDGGWTLETVLEPDYRARFDYVGASVAVDAAGETIAVGVPGEDALAGQCGAISVFTLEAGAWTHEAKLMAGEHAATRDRLGRAVALDAAGERIVAGAPADDATPARPGAAYVFDRTEEDGDGSWSRTARLQLPDGSAGDRAGAAVSLSSDGTTALVGAPGAADGAGAVAAFTDDPWDQVRTVENPTDAAAAFGGAVATNGADSVLCAGEAAESASGDSESDGSGGQNGVTGYAGVYSGVSLAPAQQLSPEGGAAGERFGTDAALAVDGDCAVIGAVADGDSASGGSEGDGSDDDGSGSSGDSTPAGGAYVFASGEDGWTRSSRLPPTGSTDASQFGRAVATDGDGYVVAVAGQRDATDDSGTTDDSSETDESDGTDESNATGGDGAETSATGTVTVFTRESPDISIDIEPDEEWPAKVPHEGGGEIEVCIEHTDSFDPATVDAATLRFGPPRLVDDGEGARPVDGGTIEDADGDGASDLVVRFSADEAGFDPDDFAARLVGQTDYGTPVSDHDFVVTTDGDGSDSSGDGSDGDGDSSDGSDGESSDDGDSGSR